MIRLALLRHGHTAWNRAGRIQGRTDIPLDAAAEEALAGRLLPPAWRGQAVVASPLSRAMRTAQLVSGTLPEAVPALVEMDWGDWEGRIAADLHAAPDADYRPVETWGWNYTPPNGESPADVRARVLHWLQALEVDTFAVTHIGVMRVILALATGWDFDRPAPFRIRRNRLYVVHVAAGGLSLSDDILPLEDRER